MSTNPSRLIKPQAIELESRQCSNSRGEKRAADYSAEFHAKVIRTFAETLDSKETARQLRISKQVVNDIMHARDFIQRRPPSMTMAGLAMVRRVA